MVGSIERKPLVDPSPPLDFLEEALHFVPSADDDRLMGAVVHREKDLAATSCNGSESLGNRQGVRSHGDQVGGGNGFSRPLPVVEIVELARERRDVGVGLELHHARRPHRRVLTGAVPQHRVGSDAEAPQKLVEGPIGGEHRLESALHLPQPRHRLTFFLGREHRTREDEVARDVAPLVSAEHLVDEIESTADFGKMRAEIGQHPEVLASFAGKEERDPLIAGDRLAREIDAAGVPKTAHFGVGETRSGDAELLPEIVEVGGDDRETRVPLPQRHVDRSCKVPELEVAHRLGARLELLRPPEELVPRPSREDHHLALPGHQAVGRRMGLLQESVGVDPTESECVDAAPSRGFPVSVDPGSGLGIEVEGRRLEPELGIGPLNVQRGRQNAMVESESGLDDAGDSRRRHRVADHRLDRAEPARGKLSLSWSEDAGQGLHLGGVADRRSRSVSFDEAHAPRVDTRGFVGSPQSELFSFGTGSHHSQTASVARDADGLHRRVDPVSVPLRVLEPLEHHHAQASTEDGAVRESVEGPDLLAARESPELAEEHERRDGSGDVDPSREGQVELATAEAADGVLDGDERGCAGGVDGVVRAHQVQAIRDPPRDDVGNQARGGIGVERRHLSLQVRPDLGNLARGVLGMERLQNLDGLIDHPPVLYDGETTAVEVGSLAENHRRRPSLGDYFGVAGIRERFARHPKRQPLVGLSPLDRPRHDPIVHGIEGGDGRDESAALAVDAVVRLRLGVVEHVHVPGLGRWIAGSVDLPHDIPPESLQVRGAGKQARHPDDRDFASFVRLLVRRFHLTFRPVPYSFLRPEALDPGLASSRPGD